MLNETALADLRKNIDAIDNQIIELLRNRSAYVMQVGELKASHMPEHISFIRSGREATMLRDLTKRLEGTFPKAAIATIWRMIISTSLNLEKPLTIAAYCRVGEVDAYWLAREYYGAFITIEREESSERIIQQVAANEISVGIVPLSESMEQPWWVRPCDEVNDIFVFAKIPFIATENDPFAPVLAIANVVPEATGDDISLLVADGVLEVEAFLAAVTSLFGGVAVLAREADHLLVEVPDYVARDDVRLQSLTSESVRLLGSYAKPIIMEE